ncbi:hypothetical protein CL646_04035 [bacterium]|nr:hypothetical protein [bacterium]
MSVDIYSQAYVNKGWGNPDGDSTCRNWDDSGNRDNWDGKYVWRHKKGRAGRRRHWMVNTKVNAGGTRTRTDQDTHSGEDCVRFSGTGDEGWNPCWTLGESTLLRNTPQDFDDGAHFGLKCEVMNSDLVNIINDKRESQFLLGPAVINTAGQRVNFLDQILFGAVTKSGKKAGGDGFCFDSANLDKVVGAQGQTCYELIQALVSKETVDDLGYDYCTNNREDIRCACINVTGMDFMERCKQNPTWAGCAQILEKAADIETLLCPFGSEEPCPTSDAYGGNPDCLAPGICTGTQVGLDDANKMFRPREGLPSCDIDLAVCNQLMQVDDISAIGDLEITQTCNIDVDGMLNDQLALDAAVDAAITADELWKESEFERQQARQARMKEDAAEADRIRDGLTDAQAADRDAERTLAGQLVAHRSANTEKRRAERMAREDQFRSEDAQRAFEREQYEASKIAGMDPKTITFFAVGLFCLIFLIIFAVKI